MFFCFALALKTIYQVLNNIRFKLKGSCLQSIALHSGVIASVPLLFDEHCTVLDI